MDATVSVCIPAYNAASYLPQAIESVLAQSFSEFELVVVDNASLDGTFSIAEAYARKDSRIRVFKNEGNIGSKGNFHKCIDLSRAEWIKFLCADDWLERDCIQRMHAAREPGVLVMACNEQYVFEPGMAEAEQKAHLQYWSDHCCLLSRRFPGRTVITAEEFAALVAEDPTLNCVDLTSAMVHRTALKRFGGFNLDLLTLDDWEWCARIGIHTGVVNVSDAVANFRIYSTSYGSEVNKHRPFKMNVISPLIIRHEVAFAPVYSPVRQAARKSKINLKHQLYDSVRRARHVIDRSSHDRHCDPYARDDWNDMVVRYPRMQSFSPDYYLHKLLRRGSRWLRRGASHLGAA